VTSRRWPRWRRRAVGGVAGSALLGLVWLGAPLALRQLAVFRVRQIELVGVRNLAPDAVIAALRLGPRASVFGDTRLLADRLRGLAGVAEARVVRRLPAALTVELREVEPAALVPAPRGSGRGLVAVDAAGRPLPFDPARSGLDLPIAASGDSGVVGVLALIQAVDPALFQTITGARGFARGGVLLEIGGRRLLVGRDAGPEVIRAVMLVAQDLAARGRAYVELDARFAGQVVVRRRATAGGGGEGGAGAS
jgi:POTRA domain-containing FtsQ-type protein